MKRIIALILIAMLAVNLCACMKSEAAKAVDDEILTIGEITLDSKASIEKVAKDIEALADEDRKQLDNLSVFENAQANYSALVVEKAEELIDGIGPVTSDSIRKIEAAEDWIETMSVEEKNRIANLSTLDEAHDAYDTLMAEEVIQLIGEIGKVTLSKEQKITKAEKAYGALTPAQKEKVTNQKVLTEARQTYNDKKEEEKRKAEEERKKAEEKKKKEIERKGKAALSALNKDYDRITDITTYSKFPQYIDTRSYVLPAIGESEGLYAMVIRYNYTGDDWLFWDEALIWIDGETYTTIIPDHEDMVRDSEQGDVWEYVNIAASDADIRMLQKIANSKETIVRFDGDHTSFDLTVSASDKQVIQTVLDAYAYLKQ